LQPEPATQNPLRIELESFAEHQLTPAITSHATPRCDHSVRRRLLQRAPRENWGPSPLLRA